MTMMLGRGAACALAVSQSTAAIMARDAASAERFARRSSIVTLVPPRLLAVVARGRLRVPSRDAGAIAQGVEPRRERTLHGGLAAPGHGGEQVVELERVRAQVVVLDLLTRYALAPALVGRAVVLDVDAPRRANALVVAWGERASAVPRGLELEEDAPVLRPPPSVGADHPEQRASVQRPAMPAP